MIRHVTRAGFLCGVALALCAGATTVRAQDTKMFDKPPTVDQLMDAFGINGGKTQFKSRGIQIDESAAPQPVSTPPRVSSAPPRPAPSQSSAPPAPAVANLNPPASQPPATQMVNVSEQAVGLRIKFDFNSAVVSPDSLPFIESIVKLLQAQPQTQLLIEGHTDSSGTYGYNMELSKRRAAAVRDVMVQRYGISSARLIATGKGPTEPLMADDPTNASNRRVQFRLRS